MKRLVLVLGSLLTAQFGVEAVASQDFRSRVSANRVTVETLTADVEAEVKFGRDVAARIAGRYGLYDNEAVTRYVNLIGQGLAMNSNRPELAYRFAVLNTDTINAYAAPGGYIFVTRGALRAMKDEAELAGVLAHEIAHVSQRHIVKELNIRGKESELGVTHFLGGGGASDPARVAFSQAIDKAVDLLFASGLKKEDEFEADRVGTIILANTGYDPTALHRYMERIKEAAGKHTEVLDATHPPMPHRIAALQELIRSEQLTAVKGGTAKKRFVNTTQTVK